MKDKIKIFWRPHPKGYKTHGGQWCVNVPNSKIPNPHVWGYFDSAWEEVFNCRPGSQYNDLLPDFKNL